MVGAAGLEPATLCLEGRCSIHLSYAPLEQLTAYWTLTETPPVWGILVGLQRLRTSVTIPAIHGLGNMSPDVHDSLFRFPRFGHPSRRCGEGHGTCIRRPQSRTPSPRQTSRLVMGRLGSSGLSRLHEGIGTSLDRAPPRAWLYQLRRVETLHEPRGRIRCTSRPNCIKNLRGNTRASSGAKARFMPPETILQGSSIAHLDACL
jgi:hypothetical protein